MNRGQQAENSLVKWSLLVLLAFLPGCSGGDAETTQDNAQGGWGLRDAGGVGAETNYGVILPDEGPATQADVPVGPEVVEPPDSGDSDTITSVDVVQTSDNGAHDVWQDTWDPGYCGHGTCDPWQIGDGHCDWDATATSPGTTEGTARAGPRM